MNEPSSIHQFTTVTLEGKPFNFADLKGKKILVVNTASQCGLTHQYETLQKLYDQYKSKGLVIVAFPCNDFMNQESGTAEEIKEFCQRNYGVTFPVMEKIHVKGNEQHPIYKWLTSREENGFRNSWVKWNFQKYLIDEKGHLNGTVSPWSKPDTKKIIEWLNN